MGYLDVFSAIKFYYPIQLVYLFTIMIHTHIHQLT